MLQIEGDRIYPPSRAGMQGVSLHTAAHFGAVKRNALKPLCQQIKIAALLNATWLDTGRTRS